MPGDPYEHHQVNNFVDYRIDMLRKTSDGERMKKIVEAEKETSGVIESEQLPIRSPKYYRIGHGNDSLIEALIQSFKKCVRLNRVSSFSLF